MIADIQIDSMTQTQKVAALLILLGPATSSEILKHITDDDVLEQITLSIAALNKLSTDTLISIVEEFYSMFQANSMISSGGMGYARSLLEKAYGAEQAQRILDRLVTILNTNPFQFFNDADPIQLATSFQNENPQLIALILAYLKPEHSAKVLNCLNPSIQYKVALKIAQMKTTNPEIISEVEKIVESRFSNIVIQDFSKAGGTEALASILNRADRATEKNVIELLEEELPDLANSVRELMFVFEDIVTLEDKAIQRVLREVDTKDLSMALKGTREDVKEKILRNMSERAQAVLLEDMEYMGPVRAREVQECQSKIVAAIRMLEASGEIVIYREDNEDELIE
ncbi:flagellar motor switch protein FliG [Candidatus Gastranaerophilus sp. (ex Termes propinquus)]|nr:flagellar motor switch protein FliG [Candidatus Gastranaerophilus sp. (ex Termes propinquus)]